MPRRALSLFSNCGAGDVGYRKAGFHFEVMAELDPRRLEVCLLNHPGAVGVPGDLRTTWVRTYRNYHECVGLEPLDLLCACPPCQGVSSARGKRGLGENPDHGMTDERNLLVEVIHNVTRVLRPRMIVVENVPAFLTRKVRHPDTQEPISAAKLLISRLAADYAAFPISVDLADYGVPQTRKRAFITFVRRTEPGLKRLLDRGEAPYPLPTHAPDFDGCHVTLRDALEQWELPPLDAKTAKNASSKRAKGLHSVPVWPDRRYDVVAAIPSGSGRSAWENDTCSECRWTSDDENDAICRKCGEPLPRPVVESEGEYRLVRGFRSSSYRRVKPDSPAATITTASGHLGSHFTIHPFENRLFSPLECALIQTFPKHFKWGSALSKWGPSNVREMIGEAVPPLFTRLHGEVLQKVLKANWRGSLLSIDDVRCRRARQNLGVGKEEAKEASE
jgi:DNA (cytosine-5)-methyltransferase 1